MKCKEVISRLKHLLLHLNQAHIKEKTLKHWQNKAWRAEINPGSKTSRLNSPKETAQKVAEQKDQCPEYWNNSTQRPKTIPAQGAFPSEDTLSAAKGDICPERSTQSSMTASGCISSNQSSSCSWIPFAPSLPNTDTQPIFPTMPCHAGSLASGRQCPICLGTPRDHPTERKRCPKAHYNKTPWWPFQHAL